MIFRIFRNTFFYILTKRPRHLVPRYCFSIACLDVSMVTLLSLEDFEVNLTEIAMPLRIKDSR